MVNKFLFFFQFGHNALFSNRNKFTTFCQNSQTILNLFLNNHYFSQGTQGGLRQKLRLLC